MKQCSLVKQTNAAFFKCQIDKMNNLSPKSLPNSIDVGKMEERFILISTLQYILDYHFFHEMQRGLVYYL